MGRRALLLDAGQTLLHTREPVGRTYARVAAGFGGIVDEAVVERRFRLAFARSWQGPRYVGDGRRFWRRVVADAIGTDDPEAFEALYQHFARASAWRVADGAVPVLERLRARGLALGVVSNWDLRLRPLLAELDLLPLFDALAISAEVGAEKPDPAIVRASLAGLDVEPHEAVLVGDGDVDEAAARDAGCAFWRFGVEVRSFEEVAARLAPG